MQCLVRMHSIMLFECYLCNFDFHLVLVVEVFEVFLEDENIHLGAYIFLTFCLGGYLGGMGIFLLVRVCQLVQVFGE